MRTDIPTKPQLESLFERWLQKAVVSGRGCPDGIGIDMNTANALNRVAAAYPNASSASIASARLSFQRQLDRMPDSDLSGDPQRDATEK